MATKSSSGAAAALLLAVAGALLLAVATPALAQQTPGAACAISCPDELYRLRGDQLPPPDRVTNQVITELRDLGPTSSAYCVCKEVAGGDTSIAKYFLSTYKLPLPSNFVNCPA